MKYKFFIICISILAFFFSCEEKKEVQETKILFEGGDSAFVFKDVSLLYSENALLKLKLEASTQIRYDNQSQLYPEGVYLELFDEEEVKITTLKADWAEYIHKSQKYTAKGNIVVKNLIEKQQLETQVLHWDLKKEQIYTDDSIKILTKNEQINGIGMSAKQDFSQYIIKDPTGIITLPENFEPSSTRRKEHIKPQSKKKTQLSKKAKPDLKQVQKISH